ncbi:MAG: hypothetical protein QOH97_5728 [Actinoplanes sp.]|nr:hypothetical protein [Actinoplanes sp.]
MFDNPASIRDGGESAVGDGAWARRPPRGSRPHDGRRGSAARGSGPDGGGAATVSRRIFQYWNIVRLWCVSWVMRASSSATVAVSAAAPSSRPVVSARRRRPVVSARRLGPAASATAAPTAEMSLKPWPARPNRPWTPSSGRPPWSGRRRSRSVAGADRRDNGGHRSYRQRGPGSVGTPVGQSTPSSRRSLATCPVALTLYIAFSTLPSSSMTKVDRITPVTVLP